MLPCIFACIQSKLAPILLFASCKEIWRHISQPIEVVWSFYFWIFTKNYNNQATITKKQLIKNLDIFEWDGNEPMLWFYIFIQLDDKLFNALI